MARPLGIGGMRLPERVVVPVQPGLRLLPPVRPRTLPFNIDGLVDVHPQTLLSLDPKTEGVGPRQIGVMAEQNGLPVLTADHRLDHVAETEIHPRVRVIRTALRHDVIVQASRLRGIAGQMGEAIAAIDAGPHGAGPDAMAGVEVAVAVNRMLGAPARLGPAVPAELNPAAVGFPGDSGIELHVTQIVLIAAFQMDHLAEHTLADHVQDRHHVPAEADVLQQHIGRAGLLLGP